MVEMERSMWWRWREVCGGDREKYEVEMERSMWWDVDMFVIIQTDNRRYGCK